MPSIALDQITIGINRRPLKDEKVAELMESIKNNGLLNAIVLDQELKLIAGLHRLTAYKLLGFKEIECNIIPCKNVEQARLAEIDENLVRSELDALERSELWLERDELLQKLGLRAKPGENQYTRKGGEIISPPLKTTFDLAKEAGYTQRSFQLGKQIARNIVPEVKEVIRGTPVAKSSTALLKVARAGSKEAEKAKQAAMAAQAALTKQEHEEAKRQTQLVIEAKAEQKQLQLVALKDVTATKVAKLAVKKVAQQEVERQISSANQPTVRTDDEWILARHLLYCGNTSSDKFISCLPGHAALAIANSLAAWEFDYLIDEARVVAVLCLEGYIHGLCSRHQMPFRYELILGNIYVALFSHQPIVKPQQPVGINGVEAIVAYLISLYTSVNSFVVAPFLGQGEVLIACEKMGRVCFAGDEDPQLVTRAIARWQNWTGKQAQTITA